MLLFSAFDQIYDNFLEKDKIERDAQRSSECK